MAEQEQSRSEEATPFKLEEARKRGSVAKSQDIIYVAVLAGLILFVFSMGWQSTLQVLQACRAVFSHAGQQTDWSPNVVAHWLSSLLQSQVTLLLPLLLILMVVAILANLAQTGPVLSFHPLSPDFNRLNPATGFKKLFSLKVLYEAAKNVIKLAVVGTVLVLCLSDLLIYFLKLSQIDPHLHAKTFLHETGGMLVKLMLAMLVLALIDGGYTKWEFARQMRMSKREVKDEHKQREGDPRIKSRLRELRLTLMKRTQGLPKLPEADVLITNPVHYAIAVKYKHGEMAAPQVIAKGAGDLALKMRELANRHHITIVQNPPLARALFRRVDIDAFVPEELYPQVAKILVWVYAIRAKNAQQAKA